MADLSKNDKIEQMYRAMYGDEQAGELGLVKMTQEMYKAWSAIILFGKAVSVIIGIVAALGTVWIAFGAWFKHVLTGK